LAAVCYGSLPFFPPRLSDLPQYKGKYTGKIVGGDAVGTCNDFPHQVSVQRKSLMTGGFSHFCGGSVLDSRTIATAGHCVNGRSTTGISVVVGTHKLDSAGRDGIRRNVEKFIVHDQYSSRDVDYDIAIIKLEREIDLANECVTPVSLPQQNQTFSPGTETFATGWGTTSEGGSTSNTLRVVGVPIVSDEDCKDSYGEDDITNRMICAGIKEGGKDSCQGDSGGPLVSKNNMLVGITSWGYGCARPQFYGVYTRVAFFADWIRMNLENPSVTVG
ncbi:Trypsin-1, partial [Orchesella cincta]